MSFATSQQSHLRQGDSGTNDDLIALHASGRETLATVGRVDRDHKGRGDYAWVQDVQLPVAGAPKRFDAPNQRGNGPPWRVPALL